LFFPEDSLKLILYFLRKVTILGGGSALEKEKYNSR